MDPDPLRPDPLAEPSPWGWLPKLIPVVVAVALIPLFALYFGMADALIHPLALAFGRPATAIVSGKRVSRARRSSGNYVEVNYQYSRDYAPRTEVKVNGAAYAALAVAERIPIHYIPGCSSCVALDDDFGSSRQQALTGLAIAVLVGLVALIQARFKKGN